MSATFTDMPESPTRGRPPGLLLNPDSVRYVLGERPQSWLAGEAGISTAHLNEIMGGKKALTPAAASRLAEVLDCPLGMLFPETVQFRTMVRHFTAPKIDAAA